MIALLVVTMICGTVLAGSRHVFTILSAKWRAELQAQERTARKERMQRHADRAIEARKVAVLEREIALKEQQVKDRPKAEPMPADLMDRIAAWDDGFAQEEERQRLLGLYAECQDWDEVRRRVPALRPVMTAEIVAPREGMIQ